MVETLVGRWVTPSMIIIKSNLPFYKIPSRYGPGPRVSIIHPNPFKLGLTDFCLNLKGW